MLWGRALSDGVLYPVQTCRYSLLLVEDPDVQWDGEPGCYQWVCFFDSNRTELQLNTVQVRTPLGLDAIGQTGPVLRGPGDNTDWPSGGGHRWITEDEVDRWPSGGLTAWERECRLYRGLLPRIIAPEPVQRSKATAEQPATQWYPDVSLWSAQRRLCDARLELGEEPEFHVATLPFDRSARYGTEGAFAPVEAYWAPQADASPWERPTKVAIRGASSERWDTAAVPPDDPGYAATGGERLGN